MERRKDLEKSDTIKLPMEHGGTRQDAVTAAVHNRVARSCGAYDDDVVEGIGFFFLIFRSC